MGMRAQNQYLATICQRPSLRTWLRRYRRRHARTFYELDPTTGDDHEPIHAHPIPRHQLPWATMRSGSVEVN